MAVLGIDVGASSAKAVVLDEDGQSAGGGQSAYEIARPRPGWSEQAPATWQAAVGVAVVQAMAEAGAPPIAAVGLSGQVHGVVPLDAAFAPLGQAIIWADERAGAQARAIEIRLGQAHLIELAGTRLAPGFMAATLAWLRHHEPARWAATRAIASPKDWLPCG